MHLNFANHPRFSADWSRFVLSKVEDLKDSLLIMSQRIRQLEDALQIEFSQRSTEDHPLLANAFLTVKNINTILPEVKQNHEDPSNVVPFGRLTVSKSGNVWYDGSTNLEVSRTHNLWLNINLILICQTALLTVCMT